MYILYKVESFTTVTLCMKKQIGVFLLLALIAFCERAGAELSANLKIRKEINRANKKTASETYVDQVSPI